MKKLILIFLILLSSCNNQKQKPTVYTTLYVYQDITKSLLKDFAEVKSIYSKNSDAHDFELSTKSTKDLMEADLFIASSITQEPFLKELKDLKIENLLIVGDKIKLEGHFYLSPKRLDEVVNTISEELIKKYPKEEKNIENNKKILLDELKKLDEKYEEVKLNNFLLTSHESFNYLQKDYNFNVESVYGEEHDNEPSTKEIKDLVESIKTNEIKYIYEDMNESSNLIKQIAKESDTKIIEVNNLETPVENKNIIIILKENLEKFMRVNE